MQTERSPIGSLAPYFVGGCSSLDAASYICTATFPREQQSLVLASAPPHSASTRNVERGCMDGWNLH
ncbi:Protein of unknown function [Pyronema omphalodes CBS 100304]|uniref:Uncharacterized protein n=1 Tax=Pyronema omphalodes (strain CBS 100304) TaxID=1076935 RepID=U4LXN4_PYROM|nr:Protein of unknown function [Pyronema omphalodes CBS 100304]